jgi:hypothetical protein
MNILQKILYSLSWIPVILLKTFPLLMLKPFVEMSWPIAFAPVGLFFLGLYLIPIAIATRGEDSRAWYKIFWLWGNDEEGYPDWAYAEGHSPWWWYAVRNPINNHRFIFNDDKPFKNYGWLPEAMEAQGLIEHKIKRAYRWRVRGIFAGYRLIWLVDNNTYSEIWIGWKVGSRVPGLGLTFQVRLRREIGT